MKRYSCLIALLLFATAFAVAQEQNQSPTDRHEPHPRHMGDKMEGGMPGHGFGGPGLGGDWWRNSDIAQSINLNEAQQTQLNQIFSSHRDNLITLRSNVEKEEGKFHDLLAQDQPQQDQVLAEMTQLQNARNALEKEFTVMSLAFRGVLTPEQWNKLQHRTHERMERRFGPHRPGGPDGPPAPGTPPGAAPQQQ
jgi:Spy/CpxP family protein refolding chaperone